MSAQEDAEDDDNGVGPIFTLFPPEDDDIEYAAQTVAATPSHHQLELQQYYDLPSIGSTVVIRQLPSQGLSFQLWPAATTLVNLLDRHRHDPTNSPLPAFASAGPDRHQRRLRILELGSGTGLVGIAAAATLGADVIATDLPHVLPNLRFNAEANLQTLTLHGGTINVAPLRWGEADDFEAIGRGFNLIMGSDVVYHDHLYEPLLRTLRFLLLGGDENVVFVMAHLRRWKKEAAFFKKAKKQFDVRSLHVDDPIPGSRVGVAVYSFARKRPPASNAAICR